MDQVPSLNGRNLPLFTDLYELTMAQVYWENGMADWESAFHYFYRTIPSGGGYAIACGLQPLVEFLVGLSFDASSIDYLATIPGTDSKPIFKTGFLDWLRNVRFDCDVDAVPEGTIVFPYEPIIRVKGGLLIAQIIETAVLNFCNYASAVATQASRICWAAGGAPVYDFSARRAPGPDGSLTTTRSAYIAGFAGTSSIWAARQAGIRPEDIKGTMAHSLVMSFDSEPAAFLAYGNAFPNNSLFLVDTYGTMEGVRNAIEAGRRLRAAGHDLLGIRLDSGDLARLSKRARQMLDEAGFQGAAIFASNDLNEMLIQSLRVQGAQIAIWGVGTKLVVGPLGGVYKLSGIRKPGANWEPRIKLSDQMAKISVPGVLGVKRYRRATGSVADAIYDLSAGPAEPSRMISMWDQTKQMNLPPAGAVGTDLLVPIMRRGALVYDLPTLGQIRDHCTQELRSMPDGIKRFENPDEYKVGLEASLHALRQKLIARGRETIDWGQDLI
ncbi:MAG TPA: nicotinate phosphoribosyltransferase [Blastocatellia bacterium]